MPLLTSRLPAGFPGKHSRAGARQGLARSLSRLLVAAHFPGPLLISQGVLPGVLLLASRLPAGDPAQASRVSPCQERDLLDQVEHWAQR